MKKRTFYFLVITGLSLTCIPERSNAATYTSSAVESKTIEAGEAKILLLRLKEINELDKSNLKFSEKKKMRMEVLSIKHRLNGPGGGLYISVGAAILIIVLLIILL